MKGLLLKEWYLVTKYCKGGMLVIFIFLATALLGNNSVFFLSFPCVYASTLPATMMSYDERMRWNTYCAVLPYHKWQVVLAKYLAGLGMMVFALGMTALTMLAWPLLGRAISMSSFASFLVIALCAGLIAASLLMPCLYKFGVEKGRFAYYGIIVFTAASTFLLSDSGSPDMAMDGAGLYGCAAVIAAAVYLLSYFLCVRIERKKKL